MKTISKVLFLENKLRSLKLNKTNILDAGTGRTSAELLIRMQPRSLRCVTNINDKRKGEPVKNLIKSTHNLNYKLIYADLSDSLLFKASQFDLILCDYLIGELEYDLVDIVIANLYRWLKPDGTILVVDREFYKPYAPIYKYTTMGEIDGKPYLNKRSDRDLTQLIDIFLHIPKNLTLYTIVERVFDFPSYWVIDWFKSKKFRVNKIEFFESEVNLSKEFTKRTHWAKQRIESLDNLYLRKGLLLELDKIKSEYKKRKIKDTEVFLREHYFLNLVK